MKIGIIGSGTWGTALAQVLGDNGNDVLVYSPNELNITDINNLHKNTMYFGEDVVLPNSIKATGDLNEVVNFSNILLFSIPTGAMREVLTKVSLLLGCNKKIIINTSKGFDTKKNQRISDLIREIIPTKNIEGIVSLIGPSHAEEVIVRDLTCICAVSLKEECARFIAQLFSNDYFRVYVNTDEVGAEIGVAMKNAIALASGILEGLDYGDNARAALCTRGLAEIVRFGTALGGKSSTYLGLTGIGDLVVTCYSFHSRNFQAGKEIGKDNSAKRFLENNTKTVEGIRTVKVIYDMARELKINVPIIESLHQIIYNNQQPREIICELMRRPLKSE